MTSSLPHPPASPSDPADPADPGAGVRIHSLRRAIPAPRLRSARWLGVLRAAVVAAALTSALLWLGVVLARVADPFPLEWQEGAYLTHSLRVLAGSPVYVPPSAEFIPTIYPPFNYVLQALAMRVLGAGLPAGRALSVLFAVLGALVIGAVVGRATRSRVAALVAGGLYLAGYSAAEAWYDLARGDSLFVFLWLASFAVLGRTGGLAAAGSALLAALAVLTKQQGIAILGIGLVHLLLTSRHRALVYIAVAATILVPAVLILERASGGWFLRYGWSFVGDHPRYLSRLVKMGARMAVALGVPLAFAAASVIESFRRLRAEQLASVWSLGLAAALGLGLVSMAKEGGSINHIMPAMAFCVIQAGFLLGDGERARRGSLVQAGLLGLVLLQLAVWARPWNARPRPEVIEAQRQVVEAVAGLPGDVLVLEDSYYGQLAGKRPNADGAALFYLGYSGLGVPDDLARRLVAREYSAVVLSYRVEPARGRTSSARQLEQLIRDNYSYARTLVPDDPRLDLLRLPRHLYLPVPAVDERGGQ